VSWSQQLRSVLYAESTILADIDKVSLKIDEMSNTQEDLAAEESLILRG
jgi:hypothetical protein